MREPNEKAVEILLVEDNPGDVVLTREAFSASKISNNIQVAKDGEEAIAMLRKEEGYESITTPDIILLDLNLPKKDGREVLKEIKDDPYLKHIPIVILSSSRAEQDIIKTYDLHANSYLIKPVDLGKFTQVISAIENFWFSVVILLDDEEAK